MRIAMLGLKGIPVGQTGGGVDRHVEELSSRLVRRGHTVYVYVRSYTLRNHRAKTWRGVRLIPLPTIRRKNFETILHTFLATLHALFMPVDIIHYHGVGPASLSWIPRILRPFTRIIATFHSIDRFAKQWGAFARAYLTFGEWIAMRVPHSTIIVSHILQIYAHRRYGKPGIFIPNGVETRAVRKTDKIAMFNLKHGSYILTVARLIKTKGIHYLIQAFRGTETDKRLVIAGAPSFSEDYAEYLARLASDDPRIMFLGYQGGETMRQLYAHAYLYVHPSEFEGLSLSILDAMGAGAPVLISNIPENMEVIDHSGFTFEARNVRDLKKKMSALIARPKKLREMARRGKTFVSKHYDWTKIISRTEEVYGLAKKVKK